MNENDYSKREIDEKRVDIMKMLDRIDPTFGYTSEG